jgi:hypothetical protein
MTASKTVRTARFEKKLFIVPFPLDSILSVCYLAEQQPRDRKR